MTIPHSPEGSIDTNNLSARDVQNLHRNADTDATNFAIHHTLGIGQNQASPGNHTHNAKDSKLLTGYVANTSPLTVIGSRAGNAALASLLTQLAIKGIIIDSTTV